MNVIILTHSTPNGLNSKQANECLHVIKEKTEIKNFRTINDLKEVTIELIKEFDRFIMIIPEWNGSFPFLFKQMIDDSGYPSAFEGKKIFLIGTSHSPFGNLIGVEQFKFILEFCGAIVWSKKACVPYIHKKFEIENPPVDTRIEKALIKFFEGC